MSLTLSLSQFLGFIGKLDDLPGDDTPRERFRRFLTESITEVGQVRDCVEDCLRTTGDQYNCALQDLVNHLGRFLGFEVTFGRYRGAAGKIGFDGHWKSPTGFHIVVEVKTSEVYAIKTAALVGYVDGLISEKKIPNWENALGLYVIGRPDPEIQQLHNAIVAEKRTNQLRTVSVESLLSLVEIMNEYDVVHEDILAVLRPSGPSVDSVVDLMARLVAEPQEEPLPQPEKEIPPPKSPVAGDVAYWMTPVKSDEEQTAEEVVQTLVGKERIYAFGDRTPGRKHLKPGDWIAFYATGKGVVGHARVISAPENKRHPRVRHPERYPWTFHLDNTHLHLDEPLAVDAPLRSRLDAFQGRDPNKSWAWFVQATRRVTEHDFGILTGQVAEP